MCILHIPCPWCLLRTPYFIAGKNDIGIVKMPPLHAKNMLPVDQCQIILTQLLAWKPSQLLSMASPAKQGGFLYSRASGTSLSLWPFSILRPQWTAAEEEELQQSMALWSSRHLLLHHLHLHLTFNRPMVDIIWFYEMRAQTGRHQNHNHWNKPWSSKNTFKSPFHTLSCTLTVCLKKENACFRQTCCGTVCGIHLPLSWRLAAANEWEKDTVCSIVNNVKMSFLCHLHLQTSASRSAASASSLASVSASASSASPASASASSSSSPVSPGSISSSASVSGAAAPDPAISATWPPSSPSSSSPSSCATAGRIFTTARVNLRSNDPH